MKKIISYFTIACAIILLFTTCKKYPEGGWSNMALKHLFGGLNNGASKIWQLSLYEVNGIDSTKYIIPNNGVTNFENNEITFFISSRSNHEYFANSKVLSFNPVFNNNKKTIEFRGGANYGTTSYPYQCNSVNCERFIFNPFISNPIPIWKIIKLKKHEFIITTTQKGNNYKIILTT